MLVRSFDSSARSTRAPDWVRAGLPEALSAPFRDRYGPQLRSRATVLVLGDARANYHASGAEAVKETVAAVEKRRDRAKRVATIGIRHGRGAGPGDGRPDARHRLC